MAHTISIRFATITDVPLILQFIKELAEYEHLLHEVVATKELLQDTLFGAKSPAEVIIGYLDDKPVSFALFFHNPFIIVFLKLRAAEIWLLIFY